MRGEVIEAIAFCPHCGAPTSPHQVSPHPAPRTSGMAIASLVCGILFIPIVGIILGYLARSHVRRSQGAVAGEGMALAGLILGYVGLGISTIGVLAAIVIANLGDVTDMAEVEAEKATIKSFYNTVMTKKIAVFPSKGSDDLRENTTAGFAAWFRKRADFIYNEFWYVESAEDVIELVEDEDKGGIPTGASGIARSDGSFSSDLNQFQKRAMSYCVAVPSVSSAKKNIRSLRNGGSFPILWTKGLGTDGEWVGDSPWGGKGGHILCSNGDVKWYDSTRGYDEKGVFTDSETAEKTENVKNAIPADWEILTPDGGDI